MAKPQHLGGQVYTHTHKALAVMDTNTGKLLNYQQLMRSSKYEKAWSLSSANEFGRLANGISGRTKNPTNTIKFIYPHDQKIENATLHMGN
jgi:hypothetical protein